MKYDMNKWAHMLTSALLGFYFLTWCWFHISTFFVVNGLWRLIEGFIIVQLFLISIIFFSRKPALSTSWSQWDAGICTIAIFYVFFLEPNGPSDPHLAPIIVQVAGSLIIMGSYLSLNRSTGILPAKRAIKTNGLYCFIRHPMYAGYQIFIFGYILNNLSLHNIIVFSVGTAAQILRILSEEKFLDRDPDFIDYKASVKYRLLPYIF